MLLTSVQHNGLGDADDNIDGLEEDTVKECLLAMTTLKEFDAESITAAVEEQLMCHGIDELNFCSFAKVTFEPGCKIRISHNSIISENMLEHHIDGKMQDSPKHKTERRKACGLLNGGVITECQHLQRLWPLGFGLGRQGSHHVP
ncbi:hypothetical protein ROHU_003753 [Labeo rohita]|uniref:Uncharacterized protein n=1 Tax=Labeo rohita TaxID=84645 RepID=A0A498NVN2_LABRO|nr:hypothetical protein ROHU_003753 [Labeo rohita]